jgi:hypothetical protein
MNDRARTGHGPTAAPLVHAARPRAWHHADAT